MMVRWLVVASVERITGGYSIKSHRFSSLGFIATALVLGLTGPVVAQEQFDARLVTDRWYISLGTSVTKFNTQAQIGFGSVLGSFIRLEDDLNLDDDRSVFRVNGFYAFNRKHAIDFTFGSASRKATSTIEKEFTVADPDDGELVTFMIGAEVRTEFDSHSTKIFYKYAFQNTGRLRAGIGAGLSIFDYRMDFSGDGEVDDGSGSISFESTIVSEDILAPIPSLMLFIEFGLTKRIILRTHAGFFRVDIGDIEGRLIETRFTLDYFFTQHIGIGLGLEGSDIDFKDQGERLFVNVSQSNFVFYLGAVFFI